MMKMLALAHAVSLCLICGISFAAEAPVFTEADLQKYSSRSGFELEEPHGRVEENKMDIPRRTREMRGRPAVAAPQGAVSDPVDESDPLPEYVPEARKEAEPLMQEIVISPEESAPPVEEEIQDKLEVERDARFLIEAMISRLEREDIEGALTYFAGSRKEQHRTVFQALKEKKVLKTAMKGYKGVHIESVYGHYAQCGVLREESGGVYSYPVQLIKDADGRWKIYSF